MFRSSFLTRLQISTFAMLILPIAVVQAADTTPDPLVFQAVTNAEPGSTVISNSQTVAGIDVAVPVSVSGGLYSINGGAFTGAPGTVISGSSLRVQQQASASLYTSTSARLNLGTPNAQYTFKVSTRKADTVPNAFTFAPRGEAALSSIQTSDPATISGLEAAAAITVTGGGYSIDGGEFTTAAGSVANNAQVRSRGMAGSAANQTTTVTVKIGGISGAFKIVTAAVAGPDTMPNAFGFAPMADAAVGSAQTSAAITVSGINASAPVSIVGGSYSINGQAFVTAAGSVRNGDSVRLRQTASTSFSTKTTAVLTIGGVAGSWDVTTVAIDTSPDPVQFQSFRNLGPGTLVVSNTVTVSGINSAVPISVSGGSYSIDGGVWTSAAGTVSNGAQVRVQMLTSSAFSSTTEAALTISSARTVFRVANLPLEKGKDTLIFASVAGVARGSLVTSNEVVISGVNPNSQVSIAGVGGTYSLNGGPFTSDDGVASNGDRVRLRLLINSPATTATTAFFVGDLGGSFSLSTAAADTTPTAFSLTPNLGSDLNLDKTKSFTVRGINAASPISIEGGTYQIGGGSFTSEPGLVNEGQTVTVSLRTASTYATDTALRVTIGGVSAIFRITTASLPKPFIDPVNAVYATAQTITITVPDGIPPGARLYYTTDRSTPTLASTPYTGPFVQSQTGIVRAALLSSDGAASGPVSTRDYQIYAIGTTMPVYVPPGTDLGLWKISLPVGRYARPFEVDPPFVAGFSSPPYFQPNADGSIDFAAPVTGLHSPGSDDPRSELRQMNADGSLASWHVGEYVQTLSAALTVTQVPSSGRIVIGQIHADDEGPVLVLLEWRGDQGQPGSLYLSIRSHPDDPGRPTVLASNVPWGSLVTYRINVSLDGVLTVIGNGNVAVVPLDPAWNVEGQYFKAGTYVLDHEGDAGEGGAARFYGINIAPTP